TPASAESNSAHYVESSANCLARRVGLTQMARRRSGFWRAARRGFDLVRERFSGRCGSAGGLALGALCSIVEEGMKNGLTLPRLNRQQAFLKVMSLRLSKSLSGPWEGGRAKLARPGASGHPRKFFDVATSRLFRPRSYSRRLPQTRCQTRTVRECHWMEY